MTQKEKLAAWTISALIIASIVGISYWLAGAPGRPTIPSEAAATSTVEQIYPCPTPEDCKG
jgi:hypothetical protein